MNKCSICGTPATDQDGDKFFCEIHYQDLIDDEVRRLLALGNPHAASSLTPMQAWQEIATLYEESSDKSTLIAFSGIRDLLVEVYKHCSDKGYVMPRSLGDYLTYLLGIGFDAFDRVSHGLTAVESVLGFAQEMRTAGLYWQLASTLIVLGVEPSLHYSLFENKGG